MKILLANPRGFCAGVERALQVVERVLEKGEAPVHVRHEAAAPTKAPAPFAPLAEADLSQAFSAESFSAESQQGHAQYQEVKAQQ